MNYLVGDIGNTSVKISILNYKFNIIKSYNIDTIKLYQKKKINNFFKNFLSKKINKKVLFSSVVPNVYKVIKKFLNDKNFFMTL